MAAHDRDKLPLAPPDPRASSDSIDESSLLAETEDLLATLDASAFGRASLSAPAVATRSSEREAKAAAADAHDDAMPSATVSWVDAHAQRGWRQPAEPSPRNENTSATTSVPKDKRREEIQQLRRDALALELQLAQLRQQRQSSLLVRNRRRHTWQELVARHCRLRQLAESENQQLKAMLHDVLHASDPGHLEAYAAASEDALTDRLPNYLQGPWRRALAPAPEPSPELSSTFESLLRRLDQGYADIDTVFHENGMHQHLTEPRSYAERKVRRLGEPCHCIQLVDVRFAPFPWLAMGLATWESNKEHNLRGSPFVYPCRDRTQDTFAVVYRKRHTLSPQQQQTQQTQQHSMNVKLVMRRYIESDRVVFVCANQIDGENELTGASSTDIGYLAISSATGLSEANSSALPVTIVRSCMQIFASSTQHGGDAKATSLLNLMISAFEEDVRFIRQRVDSILLQHQVRVSSGGRATISVVHDGDDDGDGGGGGDMGGQAPADAPRITFRTTNLVR